LFSVEIDVFVNVCVKLTTVILSLWYIKKR